MDRTQETQAREGFERRLAAEASRFDLRALVQVLLAHGWSRERILFEGNPETPRSSGIVEAIEFRKRSPQFAVITLNLGLLGDGGLLPSYYVREIQGSPQPEVFEDFVRFFDHHLVVNYLAGLWPEEDPAVHPNYDATKRALLGMGGWNSVAAIHLLAANTWPELALSVTRSAFAADTEAHGTRTGHSRLDGSSVLGRTYSQTSAGFLIDLTAEEETDSRRRSWASVVMSRFNDRVLPVLGPFRVPLHLRLRVLVHESWASLGTPGATSGYLGFDRLRGDPDAGHVMTLFRGTTASPKGIGAR